MILIAQAQAQDGTAPGQGSSLGMLIMIGIFVLAFYFLMIRPQRTREKKHRRMLDDLKKGDIVVTRGGLQGRVDDAKDDLLKVNLAEGVRVEIRRSHVEFVVKAGELIEG